MDTGDSWFLFFGSFSFRETSEPVSLRVFRPSDGIPPHLAEDLLLQLGISVPTGSHWIRLEAGLTFPLEMETLNSTDFAQTEVVFLIRFGGQRSGQARSVSPILQPVIYAASPR